jgi:hypothetical protein
MAKVEMAELKVLASVADLLIEGEAVKMDYTEDAWSYGAPPPFGVYDFKLFLDKDGIKMSQEDPKNDKSVYIQFSLIGKIVGGDFDGVPCYSRVNTRIFRGKDISTMAGLLSKLVKDPNLIPNPITPRKLAGLLEQVLKKEPIVKGELDWRGSYSYKDKDTNKDVYENVYRHYSEFPDDPENKGQKIHSIMVNNVHTGGKVEVRAMTQINRFYGKNENPTLTSQPRSVGTVAIPLVPELELPGGGVATPATVKAEVNTDEADLALLMA